METDGALLLTLATATALLCGLGMGLLAGHRQRLPLRSELVQARRLLAKSREQQQRLAAQAHQHRLRLGILQARLQGLEQQLQEREKETRALRAEHGQLQQELAETRTSLHEREHRHREQVELLNGSREALTREFEHLANRIFEERGRQFKTASRESLEDLLLPFREQISSFQNRVNQLHSESLRGQTSLESEIRKVLDIGLQMSAQATNLSEALRGDKKTVGNWGEAQLERSLQLAGLEPGDHYQAQAPYRDSRGRRRYPDFVLKLPDDKHLVIDSKVSLVDYDRAIAAREEDQRKAALDAHARAVLNHVNDLSSKDYANLPGLGSPDFVLMFMPVEPAYIEALKHNRELFNYGYERGVILVSHTTLMPILRTVANLWMVEKSNNEAREISARAGELYNQVCRVAERLQRLGTSLNTANSHYNDTVRSLVGKQGLHGKVERFRAISPTANRAMPALEPLPGELEHGRLERVLVGGQEAPVKSALAGTEEQAGD